MFVPYLSDKFIDKPRPSSLTDRCTLEVFLKVDSDNCF